MMGLFARLFNSAWSPWDDRWYSRLLAPETVAGVAIDESTAMNLPAVWACVRVIAESLASLPLHLYERLERGKSRATKNPLYTLLHDRPNPEMSAMSFRETLAYHLLTWGNCFAEKEMDKMGRIKALWPIGPDRVTVYRDSESTEIYYEVRPEGAGGPALTVPRERMLHVPGLSFNGLYGLSPIGKMRESLGLTAATQEFGARFYGSGTHPGIVVSHPDQMSETASKNLNRSLTEQYSGLGKAHRLLVLEEGMKLEKVGIPPNDAQFLETRRFQITEICRIFRVPPHLVFELERATYSNIEHQSLEFVVHSLGPWLVRFEQAYNLWILSAAERRRYFYEHLVDGLLRGDIKSRYEAYAIGRNWGWLSADDIRERENMNPLPEGQGELYLQPLNMMEAGTEPEPPPAPAPPTSPEDMPTEAYWRPYRKENLLAEAFRGVFADALGTILSREAKQLQRLWRGREELSPEQLQDFYAGDIRDFMAKKLRPATEALIKNYRPGQSNGTAEQAITALVESHIEQSVAELTGPEALEQFPHRAAPAAAAAMQLIFEQMRNADVPKHK